MFAGQFVAERETGSSPRYWGGKKLQKSKDDGPVGLTEGLGNLRGAYWR